MTTVIVLFNRDLRVHDHPALSRALAEAEHVVPLFVLDDAILKSGFAAPNRCKFLLDCLCDLDTSLAEHGGALFLRRGDTVRETLQVARDTGAAEVFASEDWSDYARQRQERLRRSLGQEGVAFRTFPGTAVVSPGMIEPAGGDHYKVFSAYHRVWERAPRRQIVPAPRAVAVPPGIERGDLPALRNLSRGDVSPDLAEGGEKAARARLKQWLARCLARYEQEHDALAADATSHLAPYLHFGCLSPLELIGRAGDRDGAAAWVRQLCWRDFYLQVHAANPSYPRQDYRHRGDRWRRSARELEAWKEGRTGFPIVDAAMRQLRREGFMHNRARMLVASFLTKDLYLDWRLGAQHFLDWLADGDLANNSGNWQWVAGTGNDTRPNRMFNPLRQAERFDPQGDYVRRYVTELGSIPGRAVHRPWELPERQRKQLRYPAPIVDHAAAAERFRKMRKV